MESASSESALQPSKLYITNMILAEKNLGNSHHAAVVGDSTVPMMYVIGASPRIKDLLL